MFEAFFSLDEVDWESKNDTRKLDAYYLQKEVTRVKVDQQKFISTGKPSHYYSKTPNSALFGIQNLGHYSKKALIKVTVI